MWHHFLIIVPAVCALGLCAVSRAAAGDAPTDEQRLQAVDKGLEHLVGLLDRGMLGGNTGGWVRCNDHALLGLALLSDGSGWEEGVYHDRHPKLLSYMEKQRFVGTGEAPYYMGVWGHGYMLWYASELADTASPMNRREIDRFVVQLIAELCSWQSKESGGWGHHPQLRPFPGAGYAEFSVITSLSLCSLLRARERGYYVDPEVIDRAFRYLDATVTGDDGAPRYAAAEDIGAGNEREGAPRGALVMLPYALDKRTTPAVRRLLNYLRKCKVFTGGHGCAALGMCHSALLFTTIDEYNYFWNLHGAGILARQKSDGSFEPLPAGERGSDDRAGSLTDGFHTLTLALPEAPWRWRQKTLPATSYHSFRGMIGRAKTLAASENAYPSIKDVAELDPDANPSLLSSRINAHLRKVLAESRQQDDAGWLAALLDPYASCQVTGASDGRVQLQLAVAPLSLPGVQAEAKVALQDGSRVLWTKRLRPKTQEMVVESVTLRTDDTADDLRLHIDWTWGGRTFSTTHALLAPAKAK